jgi:hypothetical protein
MKKKPIHSAKPDQPSPSLLIEEMLAKFMQADPEKVNERLKKKGVKKDKK